MFSQSSVMVQTSINGMFSLRTGVRRELEEKIPWKVEKTSFFIGKAFLWCLIVSCCVQLSHGHSNFFLFWGSELLYVCSFVLEEVKGVS